LKTDYFTFLEFLPAVLWLIIILVIGISINSTNAEKPHYKYFLPNLYAKLFFSFAFALVYILYYGGGDTVAYYDGAVVINNVLLKDPEVYFKIMTTSFDNSHYTLYYDQHTGLPPGWIFREPESFFVAKLMSFISLFTMKSYFAMTFILAFLTSMATWKLFELVRSYKINNERTLAIGLLLIPSVNFWCAGVSKDTIVLIATFVLIYHSFKILSNEFKAKLINYVIVIIAAFFIYKIRSFILVAISIPFMFSLSSRTIKFFGGSEFIIVAFRTFILIIGLGVAGQTILDTNERQFVQKNQFLQEASVIQQDFKNNDSYGEKRYDIGDVEFTPVGLIKALPNAVVAGIYRPFIWEARSATLLLNGLESLIFLYFTYLLFRKNFLLKWRKIRTHEFLVFCLAFILIIAFISGLTSGLFGVLVRIRSILLPFLLIVLTVEVENNTEKVIEAPSDLI
jgi:hypothetical protein